MDEKLQAISEALDGLEKEVADLVRDKQHGASPHAGAMRSRLVAAQESLAAHQAWLAGVTKTEAA